MTALIFGAGGQDGFYLTDLLQQRGVDVIGVSRIAGHDHLAGNVADRAQVEALIKEHQPTSIFHLAANSTTRHDALFENHETIATGTLNILDAVKQRSPASKVFITGSGLQFVNRGEPISEQDPFEAKSAYSVARIQSVYAARYYRTLGLHVYVGYLFHHESPHRGPNHVSQIVAQAAKRIARGEQDLLELGDLSVRKEWGFAGDVVAGILALMEQEVVLEATIGTGVAYSIAEWVECCFGRLGLDWRRHVRTKEGFSAEYPALVSDPSTIHTVGWAPRVDLPALAKMMANREEISREALA
ncbi:MAG: GDP-mannose 4,6-dehydratase [Verrucomicrobiota bacterium]|nr:GDP-mannose 4,6-dehydratase [Verrucomicrobiota bacterium]